MEIKEGLKSFHGGKTKIIPIILDQCGWEDSELSGFNILPRKGQITLREARNRNEDDIIWNDITKELKKLFNK